MAYVEERNTDDITSEDDESNGSIMRHHPQIGRAMQGRKRKREMVCDHSYIFNTGFTYPNFELAQLNFLCFFARRWLQ